MARHWWQQQQVFRRNLAEIQADPALRAYGAILALLHALTYLHWKLVQPAAVFISDQLALFHVASTSTVGFFYPLLSLSILSIFPLCWRLARPGEPASELSDLFRGRGPRAGYALVGGFSLFQLLPYAFPGDTALTGEGRLFSLHMFDAALECRATATLFDAPGAAQELAITAPALPVRIACDPIVYLSFARAICRRRDHSAQFTDFDLRLRSRHQGNGDWHTVVDVPRFCASETRYDVWRHNGWIRGR